MAKGGTAPGAGRTDIVQAAAGGGAGGSHDVYVQHMVRQARQRGMRAVVFNGRGGPPATPSRVCRG